MPLRTPSAFALVRKTDREIVLSGCTIFTFRASRSNCSPSPRCSFLLLPIHFISGIYILYPVHFIVQFPLRKSFRYLGSIIHYSLTSDADVDYRISKASAAFGALSNVLRNKHVFNHLKGEIYTALVLSTLLYGCEVWCLRLRSFHKRCVRSMCRVSLRHAFHHHTSSATLFQRLNVMDLDSYYHNRILRWAGHYARMPMTRSLGRRGSCLLAG